MTAVLPDLDTITHLDFEPPCDWPMCAEDPNPATHHAHCQATVCGCATDSLICDTCMARVRSGVVYCGTHPWPPYLARDVVTFTPLSQGGKT